MTLLAIFPYEALPYSMWMLPHQFGCHEKQNTLLSLAWQLQGFAAIICS